MIIKRDFLIGLGAGLLVASTLSLAGYLSVISDYGQEDALNDEANKQLEEAFAKNTSYEQTIESLQQEAASRQDEKETLEREVARLGQENQKIQAENKRLEQDAANKEKELEIEVDSQETAKEEEEQTPAQKPEPEPQTRPAPAPQPTQPAQPQPVRQTQPPAQPAQPPSQPAPQQDAAPVKITIADGATPEEIASAMGSSGLVSNTSEFAAYLNKTSMYVQYQPGIYEFEKGLTYDEIIESIMKGN